MAKIINKDLKISGQGSLIVNDKTVVNGNGSIVNGAAASLAKTAAYTMAAADSGLVTTFTADGATVITLPSTVVGFSFTMVNGSEDGRQQLQISPAALDKIVGGSLTGADNKDFINTKATSNKGDYVKLVADGADGWFVTEMVGTWAAEA